MGIDLGKVIADTVKEASGFFTKAGDDIAKIGDNVAKAIDQNGDGKLDLADIQTIMSKIQATQAEKQRKADLEHLKPIFPEDCEQVTFHMPKMIRVAEIDKLHAENAVCNGSIGFKTIQDDLTVITIFHNQVGAFNLSFYPEFENGVYYVDPGDKNHYISLDAYFSFVKMQRVAELQRIAQSLGAKHFRLSYREKNASSSSNSLGASGSVNNTGDKANAEVHHNVHNSSKSAMQIEAEMRFPGHAPMKPELHYLKNEINILNLINMRLDPLSPLQHQHIIIQMEQLAGIKETEAAKIDAMLKTMKVSSKVSIATEAHNEARRVWEYEIEF